MTLVNQGNQTREFKYDAEGKVLFERIPEMTATINDGTGTYWTTKYTYTNWGAVATKQDARGVITTYSYDTLHRLISVSYNTVSGVTTAPTVTYNYDNVQTSNTKGMLLSVTVGSGYSENYSYTVGIGNGGNGGNKLSLQSVTRMIDGQNYVASYQYNTANQLTQMTYPVSGRVLNIGHDLAGRVSSVADQYRTYINNFTYNGAGQVTGFSLGNVASEGYGYDANRMQLTSQTATKSGGPTNGLMNLNYYYDASAGQMGAGSTAGNAGQLMAINNSTIGGVTEGAGYTYDNLGRLITSNQSSNGSSAQRRFVYDRWGNRTGMWDAVSGGNLIQSITLQQSGGTPTNRIATVISGSTVNYGYDVAGNVTNDGVHTYGYDSENRIVSVDGGTTASYAYDYQNRRYKKTVGSAITHYIWEGGQVIAEQDGATGAAIFNYVYSGSRLLSRMGSGVINWYVSDRLSTRLVLDASGNVIGRQATLPFGEDFGESGAQEKHHFTSYEQDGEIGLDYAINRVYSAAVGRFLQVDRYRDIASVDAPQGLDRYLYTRNEPINAVDPLGLFLSNIPPSPWDPGGELFCAVFPSLCGDNLPTPRVDPERLADILGKLKELADKALPGTVMVRPSCRDVVYFPEDGRTAADWQHTNDRNNTLIRCDAVGTPRGIVKIPNGCTCTVDCTGSLDYKIDCTCWLVGAFGIKAPKTLPLGAEFPNPRRAGWSFVATRDPYVRSGSGVPCFSCGITRYTFN